MNDPQRRARILAALNRIRTANPRAPEMPRPTVELIIDGLMRDDPADVEMAVDLWIQRSRMFPHPSELRGVLDEIAAARPPTFRAPDLDPEDPDDAEVLRAMKMGAAYFPSRYRTAADYRRFDDLVTELSREFSRRVGAQDPDARGRFIFNHAKYLSAVRAAGYDPFETDAARFRSATIHDLRPSGETDDQTQDADTQSTAADRDDDELPEFPF